jgi:hypothetical protein
VPDFRIVTARRWVARQDFCGSPQDFREHADRFTAHADWDRARECPGEVACSMLRLGMRSPFVGSLWAHHKWVCVCMVCMIWMICTICIICMYNCMYFLYVWYVCIHDLYDLYACVYVWTNDLYDLYDLFVCVSMIYTYDLHVYIMCTYVRTYMRMYIRMICTYDLHVWSVLSAYNVWSVWFLWSQCMYDRTYVWSVWCMYEWSVCIYACMHVWSECMICMHVCMCNVYMYVSHLFAAGLFQRVKHDSFSMRDTRESNVYGSSMFDTRRAYMLMLNCT